MQSVRAFGRRLVRSEDCNITMSFRTFLKTEREKTVMSFRTFLKTEREKNESKQCMCIICLVWILVGSVRTPFLGTRLYSSNVDNVAVCMF